jgi:hypothetical protein
VKSLYEHGGVKQVKNITIRYGRLRVKTLAFAAPEVQAPRSVQVRLNGQPVNASSQVSGLRAVVTLVQETIVNSGGTLEVTLA